MKGWTANTVSYMYKLDAVLRFLLPRCPYPRILILDQISHEIVCDKNIPMLLRSMRHLTIRIEIGLLFAQSRTLARAYRADGQVKKAVELLGRRGKHKGACR